MADSDYGETPARTAYKHKGRKQLTPGDERPSRLKESTALKQIPRPPQKSGGPEQMLTAQTDHGTLELN